MSPRIIRFQGQLSQPQTLTQSKMIPIRLKEGIWGPWSNRKYWRMGVGVRTASMPKSARGWKGSEEVTTEQRLEKSLGECLMNTEGKAFHKMWVRSVKAQRSEKPHRVKGQRCFLWLDCNMQVGVGWYNVSSWIFSWRSWVTVEEHPPGLA